MVAKAVPAPAGLPLLPPSPAALVGLGPSVGRPIEHLAAAPVLTGTSPSPVAEPAPPADPAPSLEPAEPAAPMVAMSEPEPSAAATPDESPATTADAPASAVPGTPEASQQVAREGRRPSPRPVASRALR
ncbi:hypothetical protein Prum_092520 [Phytohabitans rumicis]|uniref:Uncharacterized protein n=1 Tax=Phytohabitans rumicis TaxID=1076125 RepID=A0A6V8LJ85_9ACTN|nr:hypothetical protein Prum_092520 [Phytohabitans rumicis]